MKNYWLTSGFYALLNQLTQMIFNLGTVSIIWRVLDKEICSVWVIFMTITAIVEISRTGLLQNGLMTFLSSEAPTEHGKINRASLFINLCLSVFIALLLFASADFLGVFFEKTVLSAMLKLYSVTVLLSAFLFQFNFIQQASLDFKGLFWSSFIRNGGLFGYVAYLFVQKQAILLENLVLCQFFAVIPAAIVAYFFAKKHITFSKTLDWAWVVKLVHYGTFTMATNLATMAHKNVDKMLLGKLLREQLSTYDLAIKINNLIEVPTMTLAAILFPQSARRSNTEGGAASAKYLYEKGVGVLLAIILPLVVAVMLFANLIVWIIGSAKYADTAPLLRLTIFYGVFMAFAVQFGTIMDSVGKPKLNFLITVVGALLNLTANFVFIKWFGLYGAVYGSLVANAVSFCIMQFILYKHFKVNVLNTLKYALDFYRTDIVNILKRK